MDDLEKTASNVFEMFKAFNNSCIVNETEVAYGDFSLILKNGTSLDQAIAAYGVMRNTNESGDFVNPDKLYVLIDDSGNGFLAVDTSSKGWLYMDFCKKEITYDVPPSIVYSFNEKSGSTEWFEESASDTGKIAGNLSAPLILTLFLMLGISTILIYNFRTKKISKLLKRT